MLELSIDVDFEEYDAWKWFCRVIENIDELNTISLRSIKISDVNLKMYMCSVYLNESTQSLRFDNCAVTKIKNFPIRK